MCTVKRSDVAGVEQYALSRGRGFEPPLALCPRRREQHPTNWPRGHLKARQPEDASSPVSD